MMTKERREEIERLLDEQRTYARQRRLAEEFVSRISARAAYRPHANRGQRTVQQAHCVGGAMIGDDVTLADQIAEVKREIGMRLKVYPREIAAERLDPGDAEARTVRMVAVLQTLEALRDRAIGAI